MIQWAVLVSCVCSILQDTVQLLNAMDPSAYDYAGLARFYATDLGLSDYNDVRQWWSDLHLENWIQHSFPTNVSDCWTLR